MDTKQSDAQVVNEFLANYRPGCSQEATIASAMLAGCLAAILLGSIQQYFDWPLGMLSGMLLGAMAGASIPTCVMWRAFRMAR
ncbi:hypothetical protein RQP54_17795 [Curvibacter sp. APW13]|uniref:hypothetical protein n=1 Tax=Curvibacter sp. APW13 TaxID=3077236 RepID=UPI0028DDBEF8|nr:hypothetical protein [Curvibacter sp. APW13]MDT8992730.1 hypothetical protein [Curvibacter sp. APW13]